MSMSGVAALSAAIFLNLSGAPAPLQVDLAVRDTVLPNGLRILVHEDHAVPTVSCFLFYATGSVHEHPGGTGVAHMLEHMLFKGTRKVGTMDSTADQRFLPRLDALDELRRKSRAKGDTASVRRVRAVMDSLSNEYRKTFVKDELWQSYRAAGGTDLNAFTTDLGTAYHVTLPRNRVEMFFWLESDRMVNAVMRDFHAERDVVREERRLNYENRPEGRYNETLEAMFWGAHPYGIPTIGYPSDIENYTRAQIEAHYQAYYAPRNAILSFAGDILADSAFAMASRYFGPIEKGASFPEVLTRDPEPVGQKRFVSIRENARPTIDIYMPTPAIQDPDLPALEILEGVLSGAAGRLEPILVDSLRLATSAGAGNYARPYASLFELSATPAPGADPERIEAILWGVLATLRDSLVSERELERVRNHVVAGRIAGLRDMLGVAQTLGFMQLYGDWRLISTYPEAVQKVTAEQVREVARKWLRPERATVGWLLPRNHSEATKTGVYKSVDGRR